MLQTWLAVSSGGPQPLLGGQAGCGVLLDAWKSWWDIVMCEHLHIQRLWGLAVCSLGLDSLSQAGEKRGDHRRFL